MLTQLYYSNEHVLFKIFIKFDIPIQFNVLSSSYKQKLIPWIFMTSGNLMQGRACFNKPCTTWAWNEAEKIYLNSIIPKCSPQTTWTGTTVSLYGTASPRTFARVPVQGVPRSSDVVVCVGDCDIRPGDGGCPDHSSQSTV